MAVPTQPSPPRDEATRQYGPAWNGGLLALPGPGGAPEIDAVRIAGTWFVRRSEDQFECACPDFCRVDHEHA